MDRSNERGAAVFIVVLVLTLLTAIGVFAARAASMGEQASGYERQNTQDHYAAEYGLLTATEELAANPDLYRDKIMHVNSTDPADTCAANRWVDAGVPSCFHLAASEAEKRMASRASGRVLFDKTAGDVPGSLGPANLQGDFDVEMTDLTRGPPLPGQKVTTSSYQVTLTSSGTVRPVTASGTCDDSAAVVQGTETMRAVVTFGGTP